MEESNKDNEVKLGGNIALVGFEILDPAELIIAKKIVGNYVKKMCTHGEYQEMRLTLKQHAHGKTFKHEIMGLALFREGRFHSNSTEWSLYTAISQVCESIIQELIHNKGLKKQQ